jgi:CheY-like chemotaxis protein
MTDTQKYQLLAVDDEIANITFYKVALSRLPVDVDTATSGSEAFEMLKKKQYDLVLLDLFMLDGTGIGLLQRAEREGLILPTVLVCSSVSDKAIISQALSLGAGGYLKKPLAYQQLLQAVCDYLNIPYPEKLAKGASASSQVLSASKSESSAVEQTRKSAEVLQTGKVESLTRAMSAMTINKKTGKVEVHTPKGVGMLEYEEGRLKKVVYNGKTSIDALEALRYESHREIHIELNN